MLWFQRVAQTLEAAEVAGWSIGPHYLAHGWAVKNGIVLPILWPEG